MLTECRGRFILGFGVSIASAAGPIYVVETTHPYYRPMATAYCNTFWFTGSILSSGAIRGGLNLGGNLSWQLPVWLQLVFPGLICMLCFLVPESPRWLYVRGKKEASVNMLTKWHGYGNFENPWGEYSPKLHVGATRHSAVEKTGTLDHVSVSHYREPGVFPIFFACFTSGRS